MNNTVYLANKILKACKAKKIVPVTYDTFAAVSVSNFATKISNVLDTLITIAKEEEYYFSLLENRITKHTISSGAEYYINCVFDTEADEIFYIRLVCSVDLESAECRFLLTLIEQ